MFSIDVSDLTELPAEDNSRTGHLPAGQSADLTCYGVTIHPGLVERLPNTVLVPLVSSSDEDVTIYELTVRGYEIDQFIAIVTAYVQQNLEFAKLLIAAIPPASPRDDVFEL